MKRAIFLDRDGVINKYLQNNYVRNWRDFSIIPDFENFWQRHREKYSFIVITNQSGINRKLVDYPFFIELCKYLMERYGIEAIYFCPHTPDEKCKCRKPQNLLLKKAIERFKVDVENSYFIGDGEEDFLCASSLNIKFILVLTGKTRLQELETWVQKPYMIVPNLSILDL
ncbi:MAG: HAD-IIIA family hydrolase [bacterium]